MSEWNDLRWNEMSPLQRYDQRVAMHLPVDVAGSANMRLAHGTCGRSGRAIQREGMTAGYLAVNPDVALHYALCCKHDPRCVDGLVLTFDLWAEDVWLLDDEEGWYGPLRHLSPDEIVAVKWIRS